MTALASGAATDDSRPSAADVTSLRGSALLLSGRFLAIGSALLVQVLVVRYLSQSSYGAFAYALAVVNLLTVVVGLGLEQAVQRFAAMYDEQGRTDRLAGALLLHLVTVVVLGTITVGGVWLAQDALVGTAVDDPQAISLLVVMSLLAPLQALDGLVMNLFAVYARPSAIFWRRYVLAPGLKLLVAVLVVLLGAPVSALAWGYVAATVIGLVVYTPVLWRLLVRRGVLRRGQKLDVPVRELLGFTLRALTADLVVIVLFASDVVIVGALGGTEQVAVLQAVQPFANGNLLVFYALIPLFIPLATRAFARADREGLRRAYSRSSLWILVFTFPVVAITVGLSEPLTLALFGEQYADSAPVLALLALGQYVLAVFGLTALSLKAVGELRLLVVVNVVVAVLNVGVNLLLVPRYGPLGAAAGTLGSLALLSALKCVVLQRATGVPGLDRDLLRGIAGVTAALLLLTAWARATDPGLPAAFALAAAVSVLVLALNRNAVDLGAVFPELARTRAGRLLCRR